jgi:hypothetical protein
MTIIGLGGLRRVGVVGAIAVGLTAIAASGASADVQAFDATTGKPDPSFGTLAATTKPIAVVPDGAHGAYLLGHIVSSGVARQVVHLLANGHSDPSFSVSLGGGAIHSAALRAGQLALVGSFTSVNGSPRHHIAIVDAGTGRLEPWAPTLPAGLAGRRPGQVAFTPSRLVASVRGAVLAWQNGRRQPLWSTPSIESPNELSGLKIATAGASIWATLNVKSRGAILASLAPASGRVSVTDPDARSVDWLQSIGGRLFESYQGTYSLVAPTKLLPSCGNVAQTTPAATDTNTYVSAVAGDDRTLYVAVAARDAGTPTKNIAISACSLSAIGMPAMLRFHGPAVASDGGVIYSMVVVGKDLLAFA